MLPTRNSRIAAAISAACVSNAKWPGVEEADIGVRNIALERFGSRGQEEWVVLAPHRQKRRLVISEIGVEVRVESDIAGIVEQQIELCLMRSRAC